MRAVTRSSDAVGPAPASSRVGSAQRVRVHREQYRQRTEVQQRRLRAASDLPTRSPKAAFGVAERLLWEAKLQLARYGLAMDCLGFEVQP